MTPTEVASMLGELARACQQQMSTEGVFKRDLNSLLSRIQEYGLVVRVRVDVYRGVGDVETIAEYGGSNRDAADSLGSNIREKGSYRFTIEGWCNREAEMFDAQRSREMYAATLDPLASIMGEHWGNRDTMTLLPRFTDSGQRQRLEKAIRDASLGGGPVTAIYLDLDRFKDVNSEFGDPGGDSVLREFGKRILTSFGDQFIAIRKGGEEFLLFFPGSQLSAVLPLAERFRQQMELISFTRIGRTNTCSIGIASFPMHVTELSPSKSLVDALVDQTMAAERRAKSEGRNCIRLAGAVPAATPGEDTSIIRGDLVECALWARQNLSPAAAPRFGSELHTFLATYLAERFENAEIEQLREVLSKSIQTFGIGVVLARAALDYQSPGAVPVVHAVKLASMALHALLRLALTGRGSLRAGDQLCVSVAANGGSGKTLAIIVRREGKEVAYVLVSPVAQDQRDLEVYAGRIWSTEPGQPGTVTRWVPPDGEASLAPILLVAIGQPSLQLGLQPWVAAVVEVDDRPVTGGGLPDFWHSNISRVIHAVLNNPNINRILVVGDETKAAHTLQVLENKSGHSASKLAQRLSLDGEAIEAFRQKNLLVTRAPAEPDPAVEALHRAYFESEEALGAAGQRRDLRGERRPRRRIPTSGFAAGAELRQTDGIRCGTLAEAYPRVIHLLRSTSGLHQSDHMSRRFCELTGFKLVLENPLAEPVPYYWAQDTSSLDEYVDRQFVQADGLFSLALKGSGAGDATTNQIQEAVRAAAQAIKDQVASRRIIMIAGHPRGDWQQPLGLVCVHVAPRMAKGRWTLHFQWVWRTVEALVGFPFSVYGSIRQSEDIFKQVNAALGERSVPVEMGELVYVALSLHMFLDEGDEDIARAIVIDAYE